MTEPLTREMVEKIDATLLPTLDRHHLRLLAHCLGSFQQMTAPGASRTIPTRDQQEQWCLKHPLLRDDPQFTLLNQFGAARQLRPWLVFSGTADLTLDHLIDQAVANTRARLDAP